MNKTLGVPDYLGHIQTAIERMERHTADVTEYLKPPLSALHTYK